MAIKESFRNQFKKEYSGLVSDISKAFTKAGKAGWKVAVTSTPRDTGTAQAGWKIVIGHKGYYVPKRFKKKPPKMPKFSFAARKHKYFTLYNNVPYIEFLEKGINPRATVQPTRAMEKAIAEITRIIKQELG